MTRIVSKPPAAQRIWEIDFLRGLSILLVVGYHLLYDLGAYVGVERFLGFSTDLSTAAWTVAQRLFAGLFILLSGISGTLTRSNVRRGLRLLAVALIITAATFVFDSSSAVWFGILHLLAVSMLIYGAAFERVKTAVCAIGGAVVLGLAAALPVLRKGLAVDSHWLLPLGIPGPGFSSFDYFPLIPWLGIFLIGAALGKSVYASKKSLLPWRLPQTLFNAAGRHSLIIYIVHQPVILGILYVLGLMR